MGFKTPVVCDAVHVVAYSVAQKHIQDESTQIF